MEKTDKRLIEANINLQNINKDMRYKMDKANEINRLIAEEIFIGRLSESLNKQLRDYLEKMLIEQEKYLK